MYGLSETCCLLNGLIKCETFEKLNWLTDVKYGFLVKIFCDNWLI